MVLSTYLASFAADLTDPADLPFLVQVAGGSGQHARRCQVSREKYSSGNLVIWNAHIGGYPNVQFQAMAAPHRCRDGN